VRSLHLHLAERRNHHAQRGKHSFLSLAHPRRLGHQGNRAQSVCAGLRPTEAEMQVELDGVVVNYTAHQWISMSDGVRLSAASWMPGRLTEPLPALIEIIPYRKRDHTAERDFQMHSALAAHGYACFRLDMRGHGDSVGLHDAHRTYADVEEIVVW